jgi:hypothetical protein
LIEAKNWSTLILQVLFAVNPVAPAWDRPGKKRRT